LTEGHIDPMTLRDMLERGERVTVVDVRKGGTTQSRRYLRMPSSVPCATC
jgi:hypothetical protein